jgi:hypothetical protein
MRLSNAAVSARQRGGREGAGFRRVVSLLSSPPATVQTSKAVQFWSRPSGRQTHSKGLGLNAAFDQGDAAGERLAVKPGVEQAGDRVEGCRFGMVERDVSRRAEHMEGGRGDRPSRVSSVERDAILARAICR